MVLMYKPSVINAPSCGEPEKAPRWDLMGTKGCGGGIRFTWMLLLVWGYVGIYRGKKYVGGATWAPRGWRARLGYGVDVEALRDQCPIRQDAGKGPKMGSHEYKRLRRWKSGFMAPLDVFRV